MGTLDRRTISDDDSAPYSEPEVPVGDRSELGAGDAEVRGPVEELEPDYRFTLANERTFLAWQRTALGLLAAAVAVVQLVPELAVSGARHVLGAVLAALAIITAGAGIRRWSRVDAAMRRGLPLPRHHLPRVLAVGLLLVSAIVFVLVIVAGTG